MGFNNDYNYAAKLALITYCYLYIAIWNSNIKILLRHVMWFDFINAAFATKQQLSIPGNQNSHPENMYLTNFHIPSAKFN